MIIQYMKHELILFNYDDDRIVNHERYKCNFCFKIFYLHNNIFKEIKYVKNTKIPLYYSNIELTCEEEQVKRLLE